MLALLARPSRLLAQRAVPPAIDRGSLVIDGGASLSRSRAKSGSTSTTGVGAGPAARLSFAGAGATTLPYVGASTRLSRLSYDSDNGASPSSTQWAFAGVAGLTWLFSRQVGIATEAFATRVAYSAKGPGNSSADITATRFGVRVGVAALIPESR